MNQQANASSSKSSARKAYHGGQIHQGGGEFVSNSHLDFMAGVRALNPSFSMSSARAAESMEGEGELAGEFAAVRQLAAQRSAILTVLDNLQWALEENDHANDGVYADYISMIAARLPQSVVALRSLLQSPRIAPRLGPLTQQIVASLGK